MPPIDDALAYINTFKAGKHPPYREIARKYGVEHTTLARRHKGKTVSQSRSVENRSKLSTKQEKTLVKYIQLLTERRLPPTRSMIKNYASYVAESDVGWSWVTRFLNRHDDELKPIWTSAMDRNRHNADSEYKYELYFKLIGDKIEEYSIEPENMYNMDEKGFMIGVLGRSKRIFDRGSVQARKVKKPLQDGSRTWVTILATICADGSSLPPSIIYQSTGQDIRRSWVDEIDPDKHQVYLRPRPPGGRTMTSDYRGLSRCLIARRRRRLVEAGDY